MEITTTTSYPLDGKAGTTGPRCGALESVSKSGEAGFGVLYGTDERPEEWALRLRRWKPKPLINRSATGFETASYIRRQITAFATERECASLSAAAVFAVILNMTSPNAEDKQIV
jgi:hypothetical protein